MASHTSSTKATSGSIKDSCQKDSLYINKQDNTASASTSASSSKSATVNKHEYSKVHIAAYLNDSSFSQILHRHTSVDESVQAHIASMQSCLDALDASMEGRKE